VTAAPTEDDLVRVAETAALAGAAVILRAARERGPGDVDAEDKGASGDYVTEVDRESERAVTEVLQAETGLPTLGEEEGGRQAERYWVVDPLDGTTNFVHGLPVVGVSVALVEDGRPTVGVVHAPFLGETFAGARGLGAERRAGAADGESTPLRVSERPVDRAVVGTGFPFRRKDVLPRYLRMLGAALERFEDLRRPGAASLDLAWTAAGVFDGFFELGLSAWDVAAGGLLIEEAGGRVTDWSGGPDYLAGDILAGPPLVHAELLRLAGA
jgi:myo-inositol-1(or 4)-monophosphatase